MLGLNLAPASAQSRLVERHRQVYEQIPDLPQENQYINRQTKKADPENTLVSRMIRYHAFTKGRPLNLRLDWKHTIADYLGANELIDPDGYPTQERLTQNPFPGDRAIIQQLSREQRNQLVEVLVSILGKP